MTKYKKLNFVNETIEEDKFIIKNYINNYINLR